MNKIIQIFGKRNSKVPIWLMRQAGRYLPEYMQVRKSVRDFLELCYTPKKAAEVTIQPIERFGFDAAIIFSDILVLPHALGWSVEFQENIGPVLRQFKSAEDFAYLKNKVPGALEKVYEAITRVKSNLVSGEALIGFAGSPWTVVSYMLEGRGKQDFSISKKFIYQNPSLTKDLIDFITQETINHLINQVRAGSNMIQLFDSWAGMLSGVEYESYVIQPTKQIVKAVKAACPEVPIIGFPKGSGFLYEEYMKDTGIDILGVDQFIPIGRMKQWQEKIIVQGNLDPVILLTDYANIARKVDEILLGLGEKGFIFNLGHGIMPSTPVDNVKFLVNYVRAFRG